MKKLHKYFIYNLTYFFIAIVLSICYWGCAYGKVFVVDESSDTTKSPIFSVVCVTCFLIIPAIIWFCILLYRQQIIFNPEVEKKFAINKYKNSDIYIINQKINNMSNNQKLCSIIKNFIKGNSLDNLFLKHEGLNLILLLEFCLLPLKINPFKYKEESFILDNEYLQYLDLSDEYVLLIKNYKQYTINLYNNYVKDAYKIQKNFLYAKNYIDFNDRSYKEYIDINNNLPSTMIINKITNLFLYLVDIEIITSKDKQSYFALLFLIYKYSKLSIIDWSNRILEEYNIDKNKDDSELIENLYNKNKFDLDISLIVKILWSRKAVKIDILSDIFKDDFYKKCYNQVMQELKKIQNMLIDKVTKLELEMDQEDHQKIVPNSKIEELITEETKLNLNYENSDIYLINQEINKMKKNKNLCKIIKNFIKRENLDIYLLEFCLIPLKNNYTYYDEVFEIDNEYFQCIDKKNEYFSLIKNYKQQTLESFEDYVEDAYEIQKNFLSEDSIFKENIDDLFLSLVDEKIITRKDKQSYFAFLFLIYKYSKLSVKDWANEVLEEYNIDSKNDKELIEFLYNEDFDISDIVKIIWARKNNLFCSYITSYESCYKQVNSEIKILKRKAKLNDLLIDKIDKNKLNIPDIDDIDLMSGEEFELFISNLFKILGYKTQLTKATGDQGIDVIATKVKLKIAIQTKCYSKPVGNHAIMEAVAGAKYYNADKIMVITNNYFTKSACELASVNNVILWDRTKLKEKIDGVK